MKKRIVSIFVLAAALAGCGHGAPIPLERGPVAMVPPIGLGRAPRRIGGVIGATATLPHAQVSLGSGQSLAAMAPLGGPLESHAESTGPVSLDFADTDIREVAAQILGSILKVDYTIDPAVKGTATFHSAQPLSGTQLIRVLQALLNQDGAALVRSGDIYRVLPAAAAATTLGVADSALAAGAVVVPLHYVSAEDLVKVLQPVVGVGARVVAAPGQNAILVSGDPEARNTVVDLVRGFDVDALSGQSYALLPTPQGSNPKDFASTLQTAFRGQAGGGLAGLVTVLPLEHAGAVLVVARQPRYIDAAKRVFALIEHEQRASLRTWHVYYLQSGRAEDVAYLLQRAFTPNDVTAQPAAPAPEPAANFGTGNNQGGTQGTGGVGGGNGAPAGLSLLSQGQAPAGGGGAAAAGGGGYGSPPSGGGPAAANPLLGGLDQTGGGASAEAMRIIPDKQNNSELVYATAEEANTLEAMLRKIDVQPLQVRIDATIAEVTLNDQLQYGTQFFFKEGSVNQTLSAVAAGTTTGSFPGFVLGASSGAVRAAISALQAVTTVRVLSSPELMVLDNQPAALQVGDLVPYLTQESQGTLIAGSPIINSVNYRQTGVILKITPRVNSDGEVTLDIAQEVSGIDTTAPTFTGISSPTFSERLVQSRVEVRDGQTVGLAGLITDSITTGNQGIPILKNIPLLGFLAGTQNNTRDRTELLVLITPHVVHDERDARALTQDLIRQLPNAAIVPAFSRSLPPTGSDDPNARLLGRIGVPP